MKSFLNEHVVVKGTKDYTHQDLKGGLYRIPEDKKDKLYDILCKYKTSMCERITPIIKFYVDIDDGTDGVDIKLFVESLKNTLKEYLSPLESNEEKKEMEELDFTYYILKNQGAEKYHVYFVNLLVDKKFALKLVKYINKKMGKKYLDDNAYNSCFRMYKVLKFKKGSYIKHSNYDFLENPQLSDLEKFKLVSIQTQETEMNCKFNEKILEEVNKNEKKQKEIKDKIKNSDRLDLDDIGYNLISNNYERDNYIYENILKIKNFEYIRYILFECLNIDRCNEYSEWTKVIMILSNLKVPISIMNEWSKLSSKYNNESLDYITKLVEKTRKDSENYCFYSQYKALLNLAKQDNNKKFEEYVIGLSPYETHVLGLEKIKKYLYDDERGVCEMFSELFGNRIITSGDEGEVKIYYWNGDIWKEDKNLKSNYLFSHYTSQNFDFYIKCLKDKLKTCDPESLESAESTESDLMTELKSVNMMRKNCNRNHFVKNCMKNTIGSNLLNDPKFQDKIDANPDIIAVKNGNIDLKTGKLLYRNYNDYNTFYLDIEYKENTPTPNMDKFMSDIMLDQEEIKDFLSQFIGYCITGHNKEQKFSVWYGDKGSNGKSVLAKLLDRTFGEYFTILDSEIFSSKKGTAGTATTHLNYIQNKRFGIMDESNKNEEFNEGLIKRMTGGTKLRIRKLHKESELIEVMLKPIMLTNFPPKFSNDKALFRRMLMIEFEAQFLDYTTDIKYDKNNPKHRWRIPDIEKLISNEEVLAYFVKYATKWYQNGCNLKLPKKVEKYNKEFQFSCDNINKFLELSCNTNVTEENNSNCATISDLYNGFCDYCHDNQLNKLPKNDFEKIIKDKGFKVHKNKYDDECFNIILKE